MMTLFFENLATYSKTRTGALQGSARPGHQEVRSTWPSSRLAVSEDIEIRLVEFSLGPLKCLKFIVALALKATKLGGNFE